ncbi:MAG TPA: thrombospondin type 3 repeat-containing protein [Polyangiaceae bacterium]
MNGRSLRLYLTSALLLTSFLSMGAPAQARDSYPGPFSEAAGYDCPVPCTLCHTSLAGKDVGPYFTVVATSGVVPDNPDSMKTVVANIRSQRTLDTDGDGKFDWQEFDEGTDPTRANTPMYCPTYGCGATIAPSRAAAPASKPLPYVVGALSVLGFALTRVVRRRRAESARP